MIETQLLDIYENIIVQIATPYSTGTGFYIAKYGLIVTNEHVVRGNKEVIVKGKSIPKQLAEIVFLDTHFDVAFLKMNTSRQFPSIDIFDGELALGEEVVAIGHPFGLDFSITKGIISSVDHAVNFSNIHYIQHDAALNPGNSGGPLINKEGQIVGINTFVIKKGNNVGFSLPYSVLKETLQKYTTEDKSAVRCSSCLEIVFEDGDYDFCTKCGARIEQIKDIHSYEPIGANKTLEKLIEELGYDVRLARTGPSNWSIHHGSAKINIIYHEKSGLITGDAYLCRLPDENIIDVYTYLLQENYTLDGLTFSIKDQGIVLSLLIYDQYFDQSSDQALFTRLFQLADDYDDRLVNQYGARWHNSDE